MNAIADPLPTGRTRSHGCTIGRHRAGRYRALNPREFAELGRSKLDGFGVNIGRLLAWTGADPAGSGSVDSSHSPWANEYG